ncbi:hypothetical protein EQ82_15120 [Klebsiella pneumoniae]|nr:hypothetical protein EQ82_15120 [Klebsiella pneumoniae]
MKMIGWDDEFGGLRLVGSGCGGAGANWRKITGVILLFYLIVFIIFYKYIIIFYTYAYTHLFD